MKINYVLISYKFNFLAEATMRSLHGLPVHLVHVAKPANYPKMFNRTGLNVVKEFTIAKDMFHGGVLDVIFHGNAFKCVRDCDYIVFVDHDCIFRNFTAIRDAFAERANGSAKIIAFAAYPSCSNQAIASEHVEYPSVFRTIPCFASKPICWPVSWTQRRKFSTLFDENSFLDTGQAIAWSMIQSGNAGDISLLVDECDYTHFCSMWKHYGFVRVAYKNPEWNIEKYAQMFAARTFAPNLYEM